MRLLALVAALALAAAPSVRARGDDGPYAVCGETDAEACPAFKDSGPLTAEEVARIKANAEPATARVENEAAPFNPDVPCPDDKIMGSSYSTAQVEAQVGRDGGGREARARHRAAQRPGGGCAAPARRARPVGCRAEGRARVWLGRVGRRGR